MEAIQFVMLRSYFGRNQPQLMSNKQSNFDFAEEFRQRTKAFALRIMKLVDRLPVAPSCRAAGAQLVRSGSSVAANYRAACRARSEREFAAKLHIALEEADESVLWLELLNESGNLSEGKLDELLIEAKAILSILGKAEKRPARIREKETVKTTQKNHRKPSRPNSYLHTLPPSNPISLHRYFRVDAHAGAQRVLRVHLVERDFDGHALGYFHEVAAGIVGGQQGEAGAGSG